MPSEMDVAPHYKLLSLFSDDTVDTVYIVYTVDTVDIAHPVDRVYTVDMWTWGLTGLMWLLYVYCHMVRTPCEYAIWRCGAS